MPVADSLSDCEEVFTSGAKRDADSACPIWVCQSQIFRIAHRRDLLLKSATIVLGSREIVSHSHLTEFLDGRLHIRISSVRPLEPCEPHVAVRNERTQP